MYLTELKQQVNSNLSSTIPMWLKRVRPDILTWLLRETATYPAKHTMERVNIVLHGPPPKCSDGNYRKFDTYDKGYRLGCNLSHRCRDVIKNRQEKQKLVLMEKYGVSNAAHIPGMQEKIKQTNLQRYGVEHHMMLKEQQDKVQSKRKNRSTEEKEQSNQKRKQCSLVKYGVEHHMKLDSQKDKVRTTNNDRYGVAFPLQNELSLLKMIAAWKTVDIEAMGEKKKNTLLERYGVNAASRIGIPLETLVVIDSRDAFREFVLNKTIADVSSQLSLSVHTVLKYADIYDAHALLDKPYGSKFEEEVATWLTENNIQFISRDRSIIAPKELDFVIPSKSIAIECCGLYWHSEVSANRGRTYHSDKFTSCKSQNIQLLTIFQDEWVNNSEAVKNRLLNVLGISNQITTARKCEVKYCSLTEVKSFLQDNHLQGHAPCSVKLGLFHDGTLLATMTFGKPRFNKKCEWELIRYCAVGNIPGAASR